MVDICLKVPDAGGHPDIGRYPDAHWHPDIGRYPPDAGGHPDAGREPDTCRYPDIRIRQNPDGAGAWRTDIRIRIRPFIRIFASG